MPAEDAGAHRKDATGYDTARDGAMGRDHDALGHEAIQQGLR
jgi:hypothetical protein